MTRTIANIALLLIIIFFANEAYNAGFSIISADAFEVKKEDVSPASLPASSGVSILTTTAKQAEDYSIIPENDLFRKERAEYVPPEEPEEKEEEPPPPPPPPIKKPNLLLFGVMSVDDINYAIIQDLDQNPSNVMKYGNASYPAKKDANQPNPRSNSKKYKIGDTVNGFKVSEILPEKVIITKENVSFDILLHDKEKKARLPVKLPNDKKSGAKTTATGDGKDGADGESKETKNEEEAKQEKYNKVKKIFGGK